MSKRKRDDSSDGAGERPRSTVDARQLTQFRGTIEQGRKSLLAALKLARGFERQKMGRRQKNASTEPRSLLQRREEVIALKQLDLDKTAKNHIIKSLLKSKRARESPIFTIVYGSQPKLDPVTPIEGIVLGRLFNSNPVKVALPRIMASAYKALGLEEPTKGQPQTQKAPVLNQNSSSDGSPPVLDPMEITDDEEDNAAAEELDDSDEDLRQYEGMLASSEEDSGSDASDHEDTKPPEKPSKAKRHAPSLSVSPPPTTTQTAFLPALNMGGYYSGSESSDEDEGKTRGPAKPKERKNRRGQRARQQLAELKHGKNAKHLQKQNNSRDAGWDKRKGAVGISGRGKDKHGTFNKPSRDNNGPATQPKPKARDDSGPLHPSWEAAKQRKMQTAAPAAFAGKKITFD